MASLFAVGLAGYVVHILWRSEETKSDVDLVLHLCCGSYFSHLQLQTTLGPLSSENEDSIIHPVHFLNQYLDGGLCSCV